MTPAELVEKVARAIEQAVPVPGNQARVAIATIAEALAKPSDAMTEAGAKTIAALPSRAAGHDYWNANACWRAMLAASPMGKEDKQ